MKKTFAGLKPRDIYRTVKVGELNNITNYKVSITITILSISVNTPKSLNYRKINSIIVIE